MIKLIDLCRILAEEEEDATDCPEKEQILFVNKSNLENALSELEKHTETLALCSSKPDEKAYAYAMKGHIEWELELYEMALEDVEKALAVKELPMAYDIRGRIKTYLGKNKEAITDFDKAIALDPKVPKPYQYRALAKRNRGLLEDALKDAETALSMDNSLVAAQYIKGIIKTDQGKYEEAVQILDIVLKLKQKYSYNIYDARGFAKYNLGRLNEAKSDLDKAIELKPGLASACYHRGLVSEKQKLFSEAIQDYEQARKLSAKYPDISKRIKECSNAIKSKDEDRRFGAGCIGAAATLALVLICGGIICLIDHFKNKNTHNTPVTATTIELPKYTDSNGQRNINLLTTTDNPKDTPQLKVYSMNEKCYQRFLEQTEKGYGLTQEYFLKTADQDGNLIITEDEIKKFEENWANMFVRSIYGPHKGKPAVMKDVVELVKKIGNNPVQYMEALKSIDTNNDKEITLEELDAAKKKQGTN